MIGYLRCAKCNRALATIVVHKGKTAIDLYEGDGTSGKAYTAEMRCPACNSVRVFHSDPVQAINIGLSTDVSP